MAYINFALVCANAYINALKFLKVKTFNNV